jgi:hypothetical protein
VRPAGVVTRGTTARERLRRVDRWLLATHADLLRRPDLLVVDLGFGAAPVTTVELFLRLQSRNSKATVIGLEIDRDRVARAQPSARAGLSFAAGGFELGGHRPHVVRAMNVLRQYDEADVASAWALMTAGLAVGGIAIEGTCDERGGLGAWLTLHGDGPAALTLAVDLGAPPSGVAARLPKALIGRNVGEERIHELLVDLDRQWRRHAGIGVFSRRQRFAAAVSGLAAAGWPVLDRPARWRRGELTVPWSAVAPR